MRQLPVDIKDIKAFLNEYINYSVINRGRIRLYQNDLYLLEQLETIWGNKVDERFRLVRTSETEYEYKVIDGNDVPEVKIGDVIAYSEEQTIDGIKPKWSIHTPTTYLNDLIDVETDTSEELSSDFSYILTFDPNTQTWQAKKTLTNIDSLKITVINVIHEIQGRTIDLDSDPQIQDLIYVNDEIIWLPAPKNHGDKVTVVKPAVNSGATLVDEELQVGEPFRVLIRVEEPDVPFTRDDTEELTTSKLTHPTMLGKLYNEVQIFCEDSDRQFSSLTLVASLETATLTTGEEVKTTNWVPVNGTGNWQYEYVDPTLGESLDDHGFDFNEENVLTAAKQKFFTVADLSTLGLITLLGDTPGNYGLTNQVLVTNPAESKYELKNLHHDLHDGEYHKNVETDGNLLTGQTLVFNRNLGDEGKFTNDFVRSNNVANLNVSVGTVIEVYSNNPITQINYPSTTEADPSWLLADGSEILAADYPDLVPILNSDTPDYLTLPNITTATDVYAFIKATNATVREVRDMSYKALDTPLELTPQPMESKEDVLSEQSIVLSSPSFNGLSYWNIRKLYIEVCIDDAYTDSNFEPQLEDSEIFQDSDFFGFEPGILDTFVTLQAKYPEGDDFVKLLQKQSLDTESFAMVIEVPVNENQEEVIFKFGTLINSYFGLTAKVIGVDYTRQLTSSLQLDTMQIKGTVVNGDVYNQQYIDGESDSLVDSTSGQAIYPIYVLANQEASEPFDYWQDVFSYLNNFDLTTVTKTTIKGDFYNSGLLTNATNVNANLQENNAKMNVTFDWENGTVIGSYDINDGASPLLLFSGIIEGTRSVVDGMYVWNITTRKTFGVEPSLPPTIRFEFEPSASPSFPIINALPKPGINDVVTYEIVHYRHTNLI